MQQLTDFLIADFREVLNLPLIALLPKVEQLQILERILFSKAQLLHQYHTAINPASYC